MSKRKSYTAETKLRFNILEYAEKHGNREVARVFDVGESSIRVWKKAKNVLKVTNRNKRALRSGTPHWINLEEKLYDWVIDQRKNEREVSTITIYLQARKFASEMIITDFTGNNKWVYCFMKRRGLSVRARTTKGQTLPMDWETKMASFKLYVENKLKDINLNQIGNMDEVSLSFDMPSNFTVHKKGDNIVKIATTGAEKCCFTVVLCVTADGGRLPPFVIFKRKSIPKEVFPNGVIVRANEKGWMVQSMMQEWLDSVWKKRKNSFFSPKSLLIFDSAPSHLTDEVKSKVRKMSELAVIPGLTKLLQPLDISVNRSFKCKIRKKSEKWMVDGYKQYTRGGNLKKASYSEVCKWIEESWNDISIDCIKNGFYKSKVCYYGDQIINEIDTDSNSEDSGIPDELRDIFENEESSDEDFDGFD